MVDNMNEAFEQATNLANKSVQGLAKNIENILNVLQPQNTAKKASIQIEPDRVETVGFWPFRKKIRHNGKQYKVNAYISMNNVIVLDFENKEEMREYFDKIK